jgi:hypothetical protein
MLRYLAPESPKKPSVGVYPWVLLCHPWDSFFATSVQIQDPTDGKAEPTDKLIVFEYLPVVEVGNSQHPTFQPGLTPCG